MPQSIKIRGIAPPDLAGQPEAVRRQYWQWVAEIALKVKDGELARGLDATGEPLRAVSAYTRKHRKSAMTPSGKGEPSAPPLMPARQRSRTRSLLAARAFSTHAELYWRYDPFTGDTWATVLNYQREAGRDVFGVSDAGMVQIQRQAWQKWAEWKRGGEAPIVRRHAFPSAALSAGPQSRIARIVAESAVPRSAPAAVRKIGTMDTSKATFGIGRSGAPVGPWSGGATERELRAWAAGTGRGGAQPIPKPEPPPNPLPKARVTKAAMGKAVRSTGPIESDAAARRKAAIEAKRKAEEAKAKAEIKARLEKEARRKAEAAAMAEAALAQGSLESGIAEAIRKPVNTMAELMAQRRAVAALLESYAKDAGTAAYHGMTEPEDFRAVEIAGVELLFADATDAVAKTAVTLAKTLKAMPESFRDATRKIVMTGQINKDEAYWANAYDMAGTITGATGGEGEIVVYRDNELLASTLAHEMGHNFAESLYGSTAPGGRYLAVIHSDEPPPGEYASKSHDEDFAETAKFYFIDRPHLAKVAPRRLEAFEAAIGGDK